MRVRDFLRGFSVGIIFTCCVLFVVFKGSNQISDEYVIERAKQLNMVFQEEDSSFIKKDNTENDNTGTQNTEEQNMTNDSTKEEDSSEDDTKDQESKEETVTIDISKGMSSGDVSDMLYDLGVIDDKKEFSMYLHDNGYSLKVKIGEFEIPMNASYEEIAKIITKS
ncbi:MAG: hypothetical protein IJA32_13745 [Lachnospiraceae bacterium]|nr:hypothetical protein [Lachnospiraceae bacterium]